MFSLTAPKQHFLHPKPSNGDDGVVEFIVRLCFTAPKKVIFDLKPSEGDDGVVEFIIFRALFVGVIEFPD